MNTGKVMIGFAIISFLLPAIICFVLGVGMRLCMNAAKDGWRELEL